MMGLGARSAEMVSAWRAPAGLQGLAGLRADAPSEARGADGERAGGPDGGRNTGAQPARTPAAQPARTPVRSQKKQQ